jgi:hypothetical protein
LTAAIAGNPEPSSTGVNALLVDFRFGKIRLYKLIVGESIHPHSEDEAPEETVQLILQLKNIDIDSDVCRVKCVYRDSIPHLSFKLNI